MKERKLRSECVLLCIYVQCQLLILDFFQGWFPTLFSITSLYLPDMNMLPFYKSGVAPASNIGQNRFHVLNVSVHSHNGLSSSD